MRTGERYGKTPNRYDLSDEKGVPAMSNDAITIDIKTDSFKYFILLFV